MEWETKAWGRVHHCFASSDVAISYLELEAGTRSSWHLHRDRYNAFHVTAGVVVVEHECLDKVLAKLLFTGQSASVAPGTKHRFRVISGGRMVEVYWPREGATCRADDIERFDVGGKDE